MAYDVSRDGAEAAQDNKADPRWERLRAGDPSVLDELLSTCEKRLWASSRTADVADVAGEVFLRTWERAVEPEAEPIRNVDAWQRQTARNICADWDERAMKEREGYQQVHARGRHKLSNGDRARRVLADIREICRRIPDGTILQEQIELGLIELSLNEDLVKSGELAQKIGLADDKRYYKLSRMRAQVREYLALLAVARSAGGCYTLQRLLCGRTGTWGWEDVRFAQLTDSALRQIEKHATPDECKRCDLVFYSTKSKNRRRYALTPALAWYATRQVSPRLGIGSREEAPARPAGERPGTGRDEGSPPRTESKAGGHVGSGRLGQTARAVSHEAERAWQLANATPGYLAQNPLAVELLQWVRDSPIVAGILRILAAALMAAGLIAGGVTITRHHTHSQQPPSGTAPSGRMGARPTEPAAVSPIDGGDGAKAPVGPPAGVHPRAGSSKRPSAGRGHVRPLPSASSSATDSAATQTSGTLTVYRGTAAKAVDLTVNMTPLSYQQFTVDGVSYGNTSAQTVRLRPGTHYLDLPGAPNWQQIPVTVDSSGNVTYSAQYDNVLSGRGTSTLTAYGQPITVDSSGCSYTTPPAIYETVSGSGPVYLAPGNTSVILPTNPRARQPVRVSSDGTVSFPAGDSGELTGAGTKAIGIACDAVTIDVSGWDYSSVGVLNAGIQSGSGPAHFRLAPAGYLLVLTNGSGTMKIPFRVDANGCFSYEARYDGVLTGKGTATLGLARALKPHMA